MSKKVVKKIGRYLLIAVGIVIFVGTIMFLYQKSQPEPVIFKTDLASYNDIVKKTLATGSIVPRKEIMIKPQAVSGIIETLYVEPGDMVRKGDKIAKVKIIPDMVNLRSAESRVERSELGYKNAKLNFDRNHELLEKKVISQADFDKIQFEFDSSAEELNSAKDNLQLIKEGVTGDMGGATNTIIRSVLTGMVLDVPVEEGNSVIQSNNFNDGTTIAVVADMNEMIFEGKIDEMDVSKLHLGMIIDLTIGAIDDTTFQAELEYISPKGVDENGSIRFEIKAAVSLNEEYFIRSGYSANADIVLSRLEQILTIPESVLKFDNDSIFVEVETAPGVFETRVVKTGESDGINTQVLEGVEEGEKMKIQGLQSM